MVDEQLGPGETAQRLIQSVKEATGCDGGVALRSSAIALEYALRAISLPAGSKVMMSALAPSWQLLTVEKFGYEPLVLDVNEQDGLITIDSFKEAVQSGGSLLILTESMGILPDIQLFLEAGIPVIEDVSQSAFSRYQSQVSEVSEGVPAQEGADELPPGKCAGMNGLYAIFGMEDRDIVTAGGGAVLFAAGRREWTVLKQLADNAPQTDLMPDMNAALAFVEVKEFKRNEEKRRELFALYSKAVMTGRHKTFVRPEGNGSTVYSFPVVLNTGFKEVQQYAHKKGIEVSPAYENSIIALRQEVLAPKCICANSLLLRCALFPLYPRLGQKDAARIVKVLSTLP